MAAANDTVLSSDKPLTKPRDDRLAYSPFAERLAESLLAMAPADGFVVALYGSWGSGKTTVVNFIMHYLENGPEDERRSSSTSTPGGSPGARISFGRSSISFRRP